MSFLHLLCTYWDTMSFGELIILIMVAGAIFLVVLLLRLMQLFIPERRVEGELMRTIMMRLDRQLTSLCSPRETVEETRDICTTCRVALQQLLFVLSNDSQRNNIELVAGLLRQMLSDGCYTKLPILFGVADKAAGGIERTQYIKQALIMARNMQHRNLTQQRRCIGSNKNEEEQRPNKFLRTGAVRTPSQSPSTPRTALNIWTNPPNLECPKTANNNLENLPEATSNEPPTTSYVFSTASPPRSPKQALKRCRDSSPKNDIRDTRPFIQGFASPESTTAAATGLLDQTLNLSANKSADNASQYLTKKVIFCPSVTYNRHPSHLLSDAVQQETQESSSVTSGNNYILEDVSDSSN